MRLDDDVQAAGHPHLAHHGGDIGLDRGLRQAQPAGDLAVGPGPAQQVENAALAAGQVRIGDCGGRALAAGAEAETVPRTGRPRA